MSEFDKPSRAEDEYFARQEIERRKQWAKERAAKMAADERTKLKETHWMKCPKCGLDLETIELKGISVDHCGGCGGTWLDAGEIEKMQAQDGLFSRVMSVFQ